MVNFTATYDRIQSRALEFNLAKALLTLLALPFFVLGFVAYAVYRVASLVVAFGWAAILEGWEQAKERKTGSP